jgi:hypothetical protein
MLNVARKVLGMKYLQLYTSIVLTPPNLIWTKYQYKITLRHKLCQDLMFIKGTNLTVFLAGWQVKNTWYLIPLNSNF